MKSIFAALALLTLLSIVFVAAANAGPITASQPINSTGTVYRVLDADTFIVNLHSPDAFARFVRDAGNDSQRLRHLDQRFRSIRVRLANVDTPESVHPDATRNTDRGRAISQEIKDLVEGQNVQLRCHDWGNHGRSICSLSTRVQGDIGLYLINKGYSPYITRWGNNPYKHHEYLAAAQSRR